MKRLCGAPFYRIMPVLFVYVAQKSPENRFFSFGEVAQNQIIWYNTCVRR